MDSVDIIKCGPPSRGPGIREQRCEYIKTEANLPAIRVKWEGLLFGGKTGTFVFAKDALAVIPVTDDDVAFEAKASKFLKGSVNFGSGVLGAIAGAVLAARTSTAGLKGIAVKYLNEKEREGYFIVVASASTIDEILSSVRSEMILPQGTSFRQSLT